MPRRSRGSQAATRRVAQRVTLVVGVQRPVADMPSSVRGMLEIKVCNCC